jgi:hypothetical protein
VCVRRPLRVLTDDGHHAAREPTEPDLPVLRPVGRPVSRQHPGESYRHAIDVRRPSEYGGGTCTVLVRRIDGRVELLFHACPETGAVLSPAQAVEIAAALTEAAAEDRSTSSQ